MPSKERVSKRLKTDKLALSESSSHNNKSSQQSHSSSHNECRAEKLRDAARKRRLEEGLEMKSLASLLPLPDDVVNKLDKGSVLRLAVSYVHLKSLTCGQRDVIEKNSNSENVDPQVNYGLQLAEGEAMLEAMEGFFICVGRSGQILYLTEHVAEYLGISQVEMMGENIMEFIHPKDHQKFYKQFMGMSQAVPRKRRNLNRCADDAGQEVVVCERMFYVRMKAMVAHGNSKTKQQEYVLTQWTGRLQLEVCKSSQYRLCCMLALCRTIPQIPIVEVQLDGNVYVSRHDLNMKYTFADPRVLTLLGYDPQELIGRSCYELFNPADVSQVLVCANKLLSDGRAISRHYRVLAKSGDWIWIQTRASIVFSANNEPQYVVAQNFICSEEEGSREHRAEQAKDPLPESMPLGFIDLTMKSGLGGGLPGGARQCVQTDSSTSEQSEPLDITDDSKSGFDIKMSPPDMSPPTQYPHPHGSMGGGGSITPTMQHSPLMGSPLNNQINKTPIGSKITAAMSGAVLNSDVMLPSTTNSMITPTNNTGTLLSDDDPVPDLDELASTIQELGPESMQWLNDLAMVSASPMHQPIDVSPPSLLQQHQQQQQPSPHQLASPVQQQQQLSPAPQPSPLSSQPSPIQSVQVSEPNLAAATSDHAYSAKPRENSRYSNLSTYYSTGDVDMRDYYTSTRYHNPNARHMSSSQSSDSILVTLLGGSNKAIPRTTARSTMTPRGGTKAPHTVMPTSLSSPYNSSATSSPLSLISSDTQDYSAYNPGLNSKLLDMQSVAPMSGDAAVRSDILQSVDNDQLFNGLTNLATVVSNDSVAQPPAASQHGTGSSYMSRAKSHPNSPSSMSPASASLSNSGWSDVYSRRSLSSPASRCGSHSPDTNGSTTGSSILERFLTTNSPINPNKGSDDAFPDEHFNERISKLNIQDPHQRAAADGNLLKQLLTGEIDGQRVQHLEQNIITTRRGSDERSPRSTAPNTPNTPHTPQTPVTPHNITPLDTNQTDLELSLDDMPNDLDSLAMDIATQGSNQWLGMDIPEIQILMHNDLDEILREENRQEDLWLQQYLDNPTETWDNQ